MLSQPHYGTSLAERLGASLSPLQEAIRSFSASLRVALPAIVESFDATRQTLSARVAVKEIVRVNGVLTQKDLPLLVDVPVLLPRAGHFTLTMPITVGDECLILFSDVCLDAWFQSGAAEESPHQISQRRHSLSDGFALVGIWNQTRVIPTYSTNSVQLRNADASTCVEVGDNWISLQADSVDVHAYGACTVRGGESVTVSGPQVNVTGSSAVHIAGNGSTTIEGKDFLHHTHSGVSTGGGTSGPVL